MKLDVTLLKRLTYAKYLYNTSIDRLHSMSPIIAAEALLRVHDAVEIFQLFVMDGLNAPTKFVFMEFWEKVKVASGKEVPYKGHFDRLNAMRVGFKHKGVCPNLAELRDLAAVIFPFFVEVCRDVLGVDFTNLSLADLVDDIGVQEHLRKADVFIESQKYEDALSEAAIALHLVLNQKYPRSPWAPSPDLLETGPSSRRPPKINHYNTGELPSGASTLIHEIEKAFEELHDRISRQSDLLKMLVWKIDLQQYSKFAQFAPHVIQNGGGNFHIAHRMGVRRPLTKRDARFCFQFVLDTALAIQQQRGELPDLFAAQRLRTAASGAKLYQVQDGLLAPCGEIPGGRDLDGLYGGWSWEEAVWQVKWEGVEGIVKDADVVQLDNQ